MELPDAREGTFRKGVFEGAQDRRDEVEQPEDLADPDLRTSDSPGDGSARPCLAGVDLGPPCPCKGEGLEYSLTPGVRAYPATCRGVQSRILGMVARRNRAILANPLLARIAVWRASLPSTVAR